MLFYSDMREDHSESKKTTQIRETVHFLEIGMEGTIILDFSPYSSHILYIYIAHSTLSTLLKIETWKSGCTFYFLQNLSKSLEKAIKMETL